MQRRVTGNMVCTLSIRYRHAQSCRNTILLHSSQSVHHTLNDDIATHIPRSASCAPALPTLFAEAITYFDTPTRLVSFFIRVEVYKQRDYSSRSFPRIAFIPRLSRSQPCTCTALRGLLDANGRWLGLFLGAFPLFSQPRKQCGVEVGCRFRWTPTARASSAWATLGQSRPAGPLVAAGPLPSAPRQATDSSGT